MTRSDIFNIQKNSITTLKKAVSYLREQVIDHKETKKFGWTQFLDESQGIKPPQPGITGTACGILALIAGGEQPASIFVKKALETLKSLQQEDGGWSTTPLKTTSLTRPTCISLNALILAKESHHSDELQRAADWLINARNMDGAWGAFYQDQRSDTVSTALAVEVLSNIKDPKYIEVTAKGVKWLVDNAQNGTWGRTPKDEPQIVHTAHVVKALCGFYNSKANLSGSILWMIKRFNEVKSGQKNFCNEIKAHHDARYPNPNDPNSASFTWTHLPKQRLMAALFSWKVDLESREVISIMKEIITNQEPEGFWRAELSEQVPIWLFTENCWVLRKFIDRVYEQHDFLKLRHGLLKLRQELIVLKSELKQTSCKQQHDAQIRQLNTRLSKLEKRGVIRRIVNVLQSVYRALRRGAIYIYSKPVFLTILIVIVVGPTTYFIVSEITNQVTIQTVTSLLSVIVSVISLFLLKKHNR